MRKVIIDLTSKNPVLIYGPAYVTPMKGEVFILGKNLIERTYIKEYKAYPIETSSEARIYVEYYKKKPEFKGNIGTKAWREYVEKFFKNYNDTLILGETDSGKTSLTVFIANYALKKGLRPAVADYDPGQGDIGIPGFIGGGIVKREILSLKNVDEPIYRFIGKTTPVGVENKLLEEAEEIYKFLKRRSDFIIINYHGWIRGTKAFKNICAMINTLEIKKIFVIDDYTLFSTLHLINKAHEIIDSIYILKKPFTRKRNRFERRRIRENAYKEFFTERDFITYTFEFDDEVFSSISTESNKYLLLDINKRREIMKILEKYLDLNEIPDCIILREGLLQLYYNSKNLNQILYRKIISELDTNIEIIILPYNDLNLLAGLKKNDSFYPGLLEKIDFKNRFIQIKVPKEVFKDKENIEEIKFGKIQLDQEFKEKRILKTSIIS